MKQRIIAVLAAAVLFLAAGCGTGQRPSETAQAANPAGVRQTVKYDARNLGEMLSAFEKVTETFTNAIAHDTKLLLEQLGDTYTEYDRNKEKIAAYYVDSIGEAEAFYDTLEAVSKDYYKCIVAQGLLDDYDAWGDAMDDLYDAWDEAHDDYYNVWDDVYEDVYTACDKMITRGLRKASYQKRSDEWSEMYQSYSDAWSAMYKACSDRWSAGYGNHWAVRSGFHRDETDVEALLEAAAAERAAQEAEKAIEETPEAEGPSEAEATPAPEETPSDPAKALRPEFKQAMDTYEAFYDEYCNFMDEYSRNPSDISLLLKYSELLSKAEEMDEAFEKWDEEELTEAEQSYYLEVSSRVMQKLLELMSNAGK